jgi:hypothetical protein
MKDRIIDVFATVLLLMTLGFSAYAGLSIPS